MHTIESLIDDADLSTESGINDVCDRISKLDVRRKSYSLINAREVVKLNYFPISIAQCKRSIRCTFIATMPHRSKNERHWTCLTRTWYR